MKTWWKIVVQSSSNEKEFLIIRSQGKKIIEIGTDLCVHRFSDNLVIMRDKEIRPIKIE